MTAFNELAAAAATAASLAMDAFSVSICVGLCRERTSVRDGLALGLSFGFFQFFMPLLGGAAASGLSGFFDVWTPWLAAALIAWVGINMIKEARNGGQGECITMTPKNIVMLSFATSLDALAVGFSIESTGGSAMLLSLLAGIITFSLSLAGALLGKKLGGRFGEKAEYLGGCVLLLIAAKIIYSVCLQ